MREVGSDTYDPTRLWLHAAHNGHNWPLPKRFRIGSGMFTGSGVVQGIVVVVGVVVVVLITG